MPLSLAIKVTSLRGTVRLHIKPPPSDHLWFGFTSMPDIDWNLESAVGERKITNSHIALLISNRFKVRKLFYTINIKVAIIITFMHEFSCLVFTYDFQMKFQMTLD